MVKSVRRMLHKQTNKQTNKQTKAIFCLVRKMFGLFYDFFLDFFSFFSPEATSYSYSTVCHLLTAPQNRHPPAILHDIAAFLFLCAPL
jgi:hypothetical protein